MRRSDSEAIELALEEDPNEALELVRELLRESDADADVWGYLAECETVRGDREAALAAWAHYLTLDPHWPEAYTARAELYADVGDLTAARAELALATEVADDDARVYRTDALLAEIAGDLNGADRAYAEGESEDPLWPAPPRFKRGAATRALQKGFDGAVVHVEEMPSGPEGGGYLRMIDRRGDGSLTFYLRNLERDLDQDAVLDDLVEAAEDALEDLGPLPN